MHDGEKLIYRLVSWFLSRIWNELHFLWPTFCTLGGTVPLPGHAHMYTYTNGSLEGWKSVFLFQPQAINTEAPDLSTEQHGPTLLKASKLAPFFNLEGESVQYAHTSCRLLPTYMTYLTGY